MKRAAQRIAGLCACSLFVSTIAVTGSAQQDRGRAATPASAAEAKMPSAVAAAFRKAYPSATVKNVAKEHENGRTQYEVESVDNGRERDLNYLADGTVVDVEEAVDASEVPTAVTAAIRARYPNAKITRREKLTITKGQVVQDEFGVTGAAAKVSELVLTPDGQWVSPKK